MIENLVLCLLMSLLLIGCSSQKEEKGSLGGNGKSQPIDTGASMAGGGSDQGREGGHFLICENGAPTLVTGSDDFETHVVFIDYFVGIDSEYSKSELEEFGIDETDYDRLDRVVKRLVELFENDNKMSLRLIDLFVFQLSFREHIEDSQVVIDDRSPGDIELTSDYLFEDIDTTNRMSIDRQTEATSLVPEHLRETVDSNREPYLLGVANEYCGSRLYQAAVVERSEFGLQVHFSQYFEDHASEMQKSYRNIHEMLRTTIPIETHQIQRLTNFFHKKFFFTGPDEIVLKTIAHISQSNNGHPFYDPFNQ